MYGLKTDWTDEQPARYWTLGDYEGAAARWCPGCGDHAVLTAIQRLCRDQQLPPEKTVFVSGIGCSSRFPHYMKTYGFHGLHGRALPIAEGIVSRRPDLNVFVATGDGDCCSIGAGHWIHAIRYNMNMTLMLFDNRIYGLTKMQTSPTSTRGQQTNTHPRGAWLDPMEPVQATLGVTNCSWVAQTIDWHPAHLYETLVAAHAHQGFSFVNIKQRCPHYTDEAFQLYREDPSRIVLLDHPEGVVLEDAVKRTFKNQQEHDPNDIDLARKIARQEDPLPVGLLYLNKEAQRYDLASVEGLATPRAEKVAALREELDRYRV
jgi:2-oxoglutarate ferredoxin oxidoreductase subunit beta